MFAGRAARMGRPAPPARQRGQALVFATITAAVVMLAMLVMVSSGQLSTEKTRLQDTGDAAAYSGALMLSRDYNFSAYTNRAMVANQVAVAQFVGMTSWARHNDSAFNGLAGAIAPCFTALVGTPSPDAVKLCADWPRYGSKARSFKNQIQTLAGNSITGLDSLMDALSKAQITYHAGTTIAVPEMVSTVIKANDPQASLSASPTNAIFATRFALSRRDFSRTYEVKKDLTRFADLTHRSLDNFSGVEDIGNFQRLGAIRPVTAFRDSGIRNIPGGAGEGVMWFAIAHSGGTELTADFKSWNAVDVSSMYGQSHYWTGCVFIVPFCFDNHYWGEVAVGLSGAYAGKTGPNATNSMLGGNYTRTATSYGNSVYLNPVPFGVQLLLGSSKIGSYGGLRPYQELSNIARDNANGMKNVEAGRAGSNIPSVVIEVEKPATALQTTANMSAGPNGEVGIGKNKVALRLKDNQVDKMMRVVAGAEVYFMRPVGRGDGATEWPSLLNPYWQARLRDTRVEAAASALRP